jgi:Mn-dependent DtxR family transcriptional regulator
VKEGKESATQTASSRPPVDEDAQEGARAVLLTILSNSAGPVADGKLKAQSEFENDLYDNTLRDLAQRGLIETSNAGHALTPDGTKAAARERERILSLW